MVGLGDRLTMILGAKPAAKLEEAFGITTVDELLRHYPRRYDKGSTVREEGQDLNSELGKHVTFIDDIARAETRWTKRKPSREFLVLTLGSGRRAISVTFFNARYLKHTLIPGTRVLVSGILGEFRGRLQLTHPDFLILDPTGRKNVGSKSLATIAAESDTDDGEIDLSLFEREFIPIYAASSTIQSWDIYACIRQVLDVLDPVDDPLPEDFVREHDLMSFDAALRAVHFSEDEAERNRARLRLTYHEAIALQWALLHHRNSMASQSGPAAPQRDDGLQADLLLTLPFDLTAGQRDVLEALTVDLAKPRPMSKLLQGEVGSGKTVVALLAMAQMVDAGYQCALLAPTEVLASQHVRSIEAILGPLAMGGQLGGDDGATRVTLLTGSMTAGEKKAARSLIASGEAGIVVGTHALLQDLVKFHRLGLVVVDEQHRFGVEQRDQLRNKGPDGLTPHLLVMTATPIPRTVALTVYGDLETLTLRELPRGRQPITTQTIFVKDKPTWLLRAWQRIIEEVDAGRQAYVVASRIDESDNVEADSNMTPSVSVVEVFEHLIMGPLSSLRMALLHGRLPAAEKDAKMAAFSAGDIDVMVCTTVIEVGVDVPNATVMVVMDADRFGISQLHQLRGRIGRGGHPSLCLLATNASEDSRSGARLKAVASTLDGFELAELDLRDRREGDVLGHVQSGGGDFELSLLSLSDHRDIIETSREFALARFGRPNPELDALAARFTTSVDFLDKS